MIREHALEVQRPKESGQTGRAWPHAAWQGSDLISQMVDQEAAEPYESLQDLAAVLLRRWKTVALSTLACLALGVFACCVLTPRFTATASLEVNRENGAAVGAVSPETGSLNDDVKTEVETDTGILQSSELALSVIEQLHLEATAPFNKIRVKTEAGLPLGQSPKRRDAYLRLFGKALKVASVPDSRLISVSFQSPDPAVAAQTANAVSQTFIAGTMERRLHSNATASFWIGKELTTLRDRMRTSEQALADFEHKTGLAGVDVQPSGQAGSQSGVSMEAHNPVLDRLNALNQELTAAEAGRISAETVYHLTEGQEPEVVLGLGAIGGSSGGAQSGLELLRGLRSQQTALKLELADVQTRFGPRNPRLLELENQASSLNGEIAAEMQRLRTRARNDFEYAQANESALRGQLARQQHLADKFTDDAVQLQLLSEEALSNRTLYQNLYSQLNQANVASGIHATRLDIVDRALVPGSSTFPNKLLLLAGSLALGLVLGSTLAFVQQSSDQSIRAARDVESAVRVPVISQLPSLAGARGSDGRNAGILSAPRSPFAESCRSLCTAVVAMLPAGSDHHRILLISSPISGDGKTTVAFNLAAALAQRGERVLLVDANLRHPGLHAFTAEAGGGLSELLLKQGSLAERAHAHPRLPGLSMLAAGRAPELPAELFSSREFENFLSEARARYRWTVIDSPPMLPYTDAAIIAEKADAVVAVLRSGVTSREALKTYTKLLLRTRAPLLGFALNGVDGRHAPFQPDAAAAPQERSLHA